MLIFVPVLLPCPPSQQLGSCNTAGVAAACAEGAKLDVPWILPMSWMWMDASNAPEN